MTLCQLGSGEWEKCAMLLRSIPGIGPVVSTMLMAEMPGLGQISGEQAAALTGLAPSRQWHPARETSHWWRETIAASRDAPGCACSHSSQSGAETFRCSLAQGRQTQTTQGHHCRSGPQTCHHRKRSVQIAPILGRPDHQTDTVASRTRKAARLAITALMRKLIVLANALMRDDQEWSPRLT